MSIRRKTRNRLLLLLSLAVVGTGALAGAYYVRRSYLNSAALRARDAGIKDAQSENYPSALTELGTYLGRFANTPEAQESRFAEALYQYALARQMVGESKSMHLVTAVALWKRYLNLKDPPLEADARHHLLDALLQLDWVPEALDASVSILKTEPTDRKSLAVRTQVLNIQHKYPEAQAAAEAWAKAFPHDLEARLNVVQAMSQQDPDHANEKFSKYAADLLASDPKEPAFELLASMAADQGLDLKDKKAAGAKLAQAAKLALAAAASDVTDITIVSRLVQQLDMLWVQSIVAGDEKDLGVAGKGLALARQRVDAHPDDLELQRLYAFELLQSGGGGGSQPVLTLLEKTTPEAAQADGRLLAIKALAAYNLGDAKEGQVLLTAAASRGIKQPAVAAVCDALRAVYVTPAEDAAAMTDLMTALGEPASKPQDLRAKLLAFMAARPDDGDAFTALKSIVNDATATRQDIRTKFDAYRQARNKSLEDLCKAAASASDPLMQYLLGEASLRAGDADSAAKALGQALAMAPAWVQANLLMAQLAVQLRQGPIAAQRADIAHALAPDDPNMLAFDTLISASVAAPGQAEPISKALALLAELQRRFPDKVSPDLKQQIALQLSRLGRNDEAIQFLAATAQSPATQNAMRPGNDTFLLARLYANQKRYPEAQALYDQLLAKEPNAEVILYAADLAGSLGQKDKVDQIMAKLDNLKSQPGGRDMAWADYYSRHGTPQQAIDHWLAAIKASPDNTMAWQRLLAFCLVTPTTEQFDATANFFTYFAQARKAAGGTVPPVPALAHLIPLADAPGRKREGPPPTTPSLLEEMCQDNFMRPVIAAVLETSSSNDAQALGKCLDALAESQKSLDALSVQEPGAVRPIQDQLIAALQKLCDDNPGVLSVQNYLVAFYGLTEHYDLCVAMAARVMQAFPDTPEAPAQTALRVLGAAGRWDEALAVAKEWRQRSLGQPMSADLAMADAELKLRKPNEAIAQLDSYLTEIKQGKKTPDEYDQVYVRYLQALLDSSQSDAAVQAVTPLMKNRRWRIQWMEMMVALPDDKAAAAALSKLDAAIPADANDERVTLAVAWDVLAGRTRSASNELNPSYEKNAFSLMDRLNTAPDSNSFLQNFGKRVLADPQNNAAGVILWAHWLLAKNSMEDARKYLQPLMTSIGGRLIWIEIAADIPDPNAAIQWLNPLNSGFNSPAESPAAIRERKLLLAKAFKEVADRTNCPANSRTTCLNAAETELEQINAQHGDNRETQTLLAIVYENQENFSAAAEIYRKMLRNSTNDVVAMNNLASILAKAKQPADGPEALKLISQAIELEPKVADFYDTQASVYALLTKNYQESLHSIQQAMSLDPANPNWRVSRIWILAISGQRTAATGELNQFKKGQDFDRLSPESRQKLQDAGL